MVFSFSIVQKTKHKKLTRVRRRLLGCSREAQPTGEDKISNQGFQCPIGKKEELFNPRLEKRSCNVIPLGWSTYQSAPFLFSEDNKLVGEVGFKPRIFIKEKMLFQKAFLCSVHTYGIHTK